MEPTNPKHSRLPTVTLAIPVARGGEYWKATWASVIPAAACFDQIVVSFNRSETQRESLKVVEGTKVQKLRAITQGSYLPAMTHLMAMLDEVTTDYVVLLCDDDLLCLEGARELRSLIHRVGRGNVTILGGFEWMAGSENHRTTCCELAAFPDGMDLDRFVASDAEKYFAFSLSGIGFPMGLYRRNEAIVATFKKGVKVDAFLASLPGALAVHQVPIPLVQIRMHEQQAGPKQSLAVRREDHLTYYFAHSLYSRSEVYARRITYYLLHTAFEVWRPRYVFHVGILFIKSLFWPGEKFYLRWFRHALGWMWNHFPRLSRKKWGSIRERWAR